MSVKIVFIHLLITALDSRDSYMAAQGSNSNKIEFKKYIYYTLYSVVVEEIE